MTRKQKELLDYITVFIQERGYSPSYDEMMEGTNSSSKSHIHRLVHSLAERNLIEFLPGRARSVELRQHG